jgi:hypothetical protein
MIDGLDLYNGQDATKHDTVDVGNANADLGDRDKQAFALLRITQYSYNGNNSACSQKAQTSVGRRRIRRSAREAWQLSSV